MLDVQTILHPTDFSGGAGVAMAHALGLARRHDARLHVLHVRPALGDNPILGAFRAALGEAAFEQQLEAEARRQLDAWVARYGAADVEVLPVLGQGIAPAEVIVDYAVNEAVDVIVLGHHGRRGFRRRMLGSVAHEVTSRAPCPTVAVPLLSPLRPYGPGRCVVAPVDFSIHSIHALAYGKQLAAVYDLPLHVLHVVDPLTNQLLADAGREAVEVAQREAVAWAGDRMRWLQDEVAGPAPKDVVLHVAAGYPPAEIVSYAEAQHAALVVIASHGRRGLAHVLMGSVAEGVLRQAPCPVFITRPFGRSLLPEGLRDAATTVPDASP